MSDNFKSEEINFQAMGTGVSAEIVVKTPADIARVKTALKNIKNIFEKNEKIFSRFRSDSELTRINNNLGKETEVSPEMFEVLELCLKFHEISEGYFDPRIIGNLENIGYDKNFLSNNLNKSEEKNIKLENISGKLTDDLILNSNKLTVIFKKRLDTTGIAKGYTVDEAAQYFKSNNFSDFIVDAGGDMFAQGLDKKGEDWKIEIEGLENNKIMLKLKNEGVATSGISRKKWIIGGKKFHHLINPKDTENFSFDLKTVTVIKEKTVEADGRAKVLFLMGRTKGLKFANDNNLKVLFLDHKNNIYLSEKMKENTESQALGNLAKTG
jgi:FAD:protein FMN transferase